MNTNMNLNASDFVDNFNGAVKDVLNLVDKVVLSIICHLYNIRLSELSEDDLIEQGQELTDIVVGGLVDATRLGGLAQAILSESPVGKVDSDEDSAPAMPEESVAPDHDEPEIPRYWKGMSPDRIEELTKQATWKIFEEFQGKFRYADSNQVLWRAISFSHMRGRDFEREYPMRNVRQPNVEMSEEEYDICQTEHLVPSDSKGCQGCSEEDICPCYRIVEMSEVEYNICQTMQLGSSNGCQGCSDEDTCPDYRTKAPEEIAPREGQESVAREYAPE